MIISSVNNLTVNAPKTYLANPGTIGSTVFSVKNTDVFSISNAVQFGETGEAQSEILLLSANTPSGTLGTATSAFVFDHPADTPIYKIKYDQIVFERSTAGTAGTAAPMTNGTVGIMANGTVTSFEDTTGTTTYAYRTYFQNSVLAQQSSESDWIIPGGFPFYSLGKMRQRVKDKLVSAGYINGIQVTDNEIDDWVNEWLELMTNTEIDVDEAYSMGTFALSFAGGQELGTITATDFKQLRRVWYADNSGTFQATQMESNTFSPNKTFSTTYPYFYMEGDNVIGRKPSDATMGATAGTLFCEYYKLSPQMVNDSDNLPTPMQGYSTSFVEYAVGNALIKDQKVDIGQSKIQEAFSLMDKFKREITPRNKTGPLYQDIVEDTAADQELWLGLIPPLIAPLLAISALLHFLPLLLKI